MRTWQGPQVKWLINRSWVEVCLAQTDGKGRVRTAVMFVCRDLTSAYNASLPELPPPLAVPTTVARPIVAAAQGPVTTTNVTAATEARQAASAALQQPGNGSAGSHAVKAPDGEAAPETPHRKQRRSRSKHSSTGASMSGDSPTPEEVPVFLRNGPGVRTPVTCLA